MRNLLWQVFLIQNEMNPFIAEVISQFESFSGVHGGRLWKFDRLNRGLRLDILIRKLKFFMKCRTTTNRKLRQFRLIFQEKAQKLSRHSPSLNLCVDGNKGQPIQSLFVSKETATRRNLLVSNHTRHDLLTFSWLFLERNSVASEIFEPCRGRFRCCHSKPKLLPCYAPWYF